MCAYDRVHDLTIRSAAPVHVPHCSIRVHGRSAPGVGSARARPGQAISFAPDSPIGDVKLSMAAEMRLEEEVVVEVEVEVGNRCRLSLSVLSPDLHDLHAISGFLSTVYGPAQVPSVNAVVLTPTYSDFEALSQASYLVLSGPGLTWAWLVPLCFVLCQYYAPPCCPSPSRSIFPAPRTPDNHTTEHELRILDALLCSKRSRAPSGPAGQPEAPFTGTPAQTSSRGTPPYKNTCTGTTRPSAHQR